MVQTAPALFVFCFLQIAVHLLLILGAGRMAGFSRKELLLASNANVGGGRCLAGAALPPVRKLLWPCLRKTLHISCGLEELSNLVCSVE